MTTQRNSEPLSEKPNKQRARKNNSLQLWQHPQDLFKLNSDQILSWKRKEYIKYHPYPRKYRDLIYAERGRKLTLILGVSCSSGRKHIHDIWTVLAGFEVGIKNIHIGWVGKWAQSVRNLGRMKMI